jgi:hypothetical protein
MRMRSDLSGSAFQKRICSIYVVGWQKLGGLSRRQSQIGHKESRFMIFKGYAAIGRLNTTGARQSGDLTGGRSM